VSVAKKHFYAANSAHKHAKTAVAAAVSRKVRKHMELHTEYHTTTFESTERGAAMIQHFAQHFAASVVTELLTGLLPVERPRRIASMREFGPKYADIARGPAPERWLERHASGEVTYACTIDDLPNLGGVARSGAIDVDQGGRERLIEQLRVFVANGLHAFAICVSTPSGHAGGHVWLLYPESAPARDIAYQMRCLALPSEKAAEVWPGNQNIRLPFGFHRRAKTFGEFIYLTHYDEIVSFDLDDPAQRASAAGFAMALAEANPLPPAAPSAKPAPVLQHRPASQSPSGQPGDRRAAVDELIEGVLSELRLAGPGTRNQATMKAARRLGQLAASQDMVYCSLDENGLIDAVIETAIAAGYDPRDARRVAKHAFAYGKNKPAGAKRVREQREFNSTRNQPAAYTDAQRRAYGEQQRARRLERVRAVLDSVEARLTNVRFNFAIPKGANAEAHHNRTMQLARCLLDSAREKNSIQLRLSNQRLVPLVGFSKRNLQYCFRELEAAGFGTRAGGKKLENINITQTSLWTFSQQTTLDDHLAAWEVYSFDDSVHHSVDELNEVLADETLYTEDIGCKWHQEAVKPAEKDALEPESVNRFESEALNLALECHLHPIIYIEESYNKTYKNHNAPPPPQPEAPNAGLLSYVRALAREADEPGWPLIDYAGYTNGQLEAEAERLEHLLRVGARYESSGSSTEIAHNSAPASEVSSLEPSKAEQDTNLNETSIGAFGAAEQAKQERAGGERPSEASVGASYNPEDDWTNSTTEHEPPRAWMHSLKPSAYYTLRFGQQHALAFALDPSYVPDAADTYETETKLIAPDDPALAIKFYRLQGKMRKSRGAQRFKLQIELEKLGRRVSLAEAEQIRLMRAAAKQSTIGTTEQTDMLVELEAERD
jgi:hypothetical protein